MATQLLNVMSYSAGAVAVNLEYDDQTLQVAALQSENSTQDSCWVRITNSAVPAQQFTTTLAPGSNQRFPLPAGALTLQQLVGPDGALHLSYTPWTFNSRFPA